MTVQDIRTSLRITTTDYDDELKVLMQEALSDLGLAGIDTIRMQELDPPIARAVRTYCRMSFGSPDDYDRLKASYDEQKAQLQMATGYGLEAD